MQPLSNGLVVVSNRGPYILSEEDTLKRSVSGLVSAVEPVFTGYGGTWVAWCGRLDNDMQGLRLAVPPGAPRYYLQEVVLTEPEYHAYYHRFSNSCLWPLAHQLIDKCIFDRRDWQAYCNVNSKFAQVTCDTANEGDLFWIHDYHLARVPQLIRRRYPEARIGFFWHIPFPPPDVFRVLPWGRQILHGLLGSNLVAFHTRSYMENFLACVNHYFQARVSQEQGVVRLNERRVLVRAFPVGVHWQHFEQLASSPRVQNRAKEIRQAVGAQHLLLGVDRLDYTKGIPERIKALGILLEKYPEYRGKVTLLQVGVPSRNGIGAYGKLKQEVEQAIGQVNGLYDHNYQAVPVRYLHRSLEEEELVAHYLAADVLLVTALRDGLNLVAKEFVASRIDGKGVLILSPFAGAAEELEAALLVNPYDSHQLAARIRLALEMPLAEQQRRQKLLRQAVKSRDLRWWWQNNLKLLTSTQTYSPGEKILDVKTRVAGLL